MKGNKGPQRPNFGFDIFLKNFAGDLASQEASTAIPITSELFFQSNPFFKLRAHLGLPIYAIPKLVALSFTDEIMRSDSLWKVAPP